MKTAIVYFSLDGDCRYVAHKLANKINNEVDIFSIETVKPYPKEGFMKMLVGGFSALKKDKPAIKAMNFDSRKYDRIILGTPVWAGNFAPPIRTFFMNNYILDKEVWLYACSSSGNSEKALGNLRRALDGCQVMDKELSLIDPFVKSNKEMDELIESFVGNFK